jgi:hypothetical protein
MNAWSHLPNAAHIDRVVASVKSHPELWGQVRVQAWDQVWKQARDQVWVQARDQAIDQARDQSWYLARDQEGGQAMGALLALVAYDDCATYLQLPIDQLKMLYQLNEHPACLLLQPAVLVFAKEKELVQG